MTTIDADRQTSQKTVAECVQTWGNSASIGLLDPSCKIFTIPSVDGVIGYHEGTHCIVGVGDPLCEDSNLGKLYYAFQKHWEEKNKKIVYMLASEKFKNWALQDSCHAYMQIADDLIVDPSNSPLEGSKGRKLRNKVSHSQRAGVVVKEYPGNDPKLEKAIEDASNEWLKGRKGLQLYLANVHLFDERTGKRWFYAIKKGKVVGVLLLNRLESRQGWLFNLLMATPDAPWGTSEFLAVSALDTLRNEGCRYVTFGPVPGKSIGEIKGMGMFSNWLAHIGYKVTNWVFDLSGRKVYWTKFNPQCENTYLLLNNPHMGIGDVLDILRALNTSI